MKHLQFSVLLAATALAGVGATAFRDVAAPSAPVRSGNLEPLPTFASAAAAAPHFKLLEPASWIVENDRGDPQKAGPCGGTNADWGKESYIVNEAKGGAKQHIKLQETVFHPGHFRVAIAVNSFTELPPDPKITTRPDSARGPMSVSAEIQDPAVAPVLADGLFVRTQRPAALEMFETDVTLPNINCDHCILQVVQFMAEHANNNPGGYTYHHCAIMHITADPSKPLDTRWPAQRRTN